MFSFKYFQPNKALYDAKKYLIKIIVKLSWSNCQITHKIVKWLFDSVNYIKICFWQIVRAKKYKLDCRIALAPLLQASFAAKLVKNEVNWLLKLEKKRRRRKNSSNFSTSLFRSHYRHLTSSSVSNLFPTFTHQ